MENIKRIGLCLLSGCILMTATPISAAAAWTGEIAPNETYAAAVQQLNEQQLAQIKQWLLVPPALQVQIEQSQPYYWSAGERWIIQVTILYNGERIAGAGVDAATGKCIKDILMYRGETQDAPSMAKNILGVWGNGSAISDDSGMLWATAYNTTFSADGRVSQKGWRNQDAGTYRVVDENTVVATYSYNTFDSPGYGYQLIKGYTYTVTYSYNASEDTLYADYSEEFENAVNSNANDGTLYRISTYGTMSDWVPETFPDGNTPDTTSDVPSAWAAEEIEAARSAGIIPEHLDHQYQQNITREEFCEIAAKLIESKTGETITDVMAQKGLTARNPFSDTQNDAVIAMNALGIVNGTGEGRFSPDEAISREQAATMLTRLAKVLNLSGPSSVNLTFADASAISDWAYYAIGFVSTCQDSTNGTYVMGGTGQNQFSPAECYTREQAIASFLRLYHAAGACTASQIRIDRPHAAANLDIVNFQGYTSEAIPLSNGLPVIGIKMPERASSANDGIFVLENGVRLDTDEYEVWLKPYEDEPIPATIEDGHRIVAHQTGNAILTVQSKVTGTVWQSFNLIVTDNSDRMLFDLAVPVQTMDTALYGKQAFNFANCGIYVEDYTVTIGADGKHHITLTAYNTNAVDGAFDIYDKDSNYLGSERIDKNDILPSSPWEAVSNLFMVGYDLASGDTLTYRQTGQSTETRIELEVPAGGAVVMSNNPATSSGAMSYNLSSLLLDSADAVERFANLNQDQKKLLNDSLASAVQQSLIDLKDTVSVQKLIASEMKDVAKNITVSNSFDSADEIISDWLTVLSSAGINWKQLMKDVEADANTWLAGLAPNTLTDIIEKAGGAAGASLKYMFDISNTAELIPQIVQLGSAADCESVYILVRQDLPWN